MCICEDHTLTNSIYVGIIATIMHESKNRHGYISIEQL
jgi:hypothetical protein